MAVFLYYEEVLPVLAGRVLKVGPFPTTVKTWSLFLFFVPSTGEMVENKDK